MTYRRAKHAVIRWTHSVLFELALAQIVVGFGLWIVAYVIHSGEPPIVLAMSALALVFSGFTTAAVAATDEN